MQEPLRIFGMIKIINVGITIFLFTYRFLRVITFVRMKTNNRLLFCDNTLWGLLNFRGEVLHHMKDMGYDIYICAPNDGDDQMKAQIPDSYHYVPVKMAKNSTNPIGDLKYFAQILRIFRSVRPRYVFTYTIKPNIYGAFAGKLLHVKVNAMMAGMGYVFIQNSLIAHLVRKYYSLALRNVRHLMVLNEGNVQYLKEHHFIDSSKIVWLKGGEGVNLEKFPYFDNSSEQTTFLFIGRILKDKGYREFVEAASLIKHRHPNVSFEVLGAFDAAYPNSIPLEEIRKNVADGIIKYDGFTNDMFEIFKRHGVVVVLPSYSEGMSRSLMEACAVGKPIITSDIFGCKELVDNGKNGFLVPPKNALALAEAMERYLSLSSEGKNAYSLASRQKAEQVFDVKKVFEIYDKIIND